MKNILYNQSSCILVGREHCPLNSVIRIGDIQIGGDELTIIAGPCTVENEEQLMKTAAAVAASGAKFLRGGAYKPSTSPYSFHGLGLPALKLLFEAGKQFGLKVVTEIMDLRKLELISQYCDVLQVGARNMHNYDLLREVGKSKMPVILKRGISARYEEWLLAAEHIAYEGNERIILCERGIRTMETYTRNTLDLTAVPVMKTLSHLPIIVDPSHGTGRRELVLPMAKAAIACGADGIMVEVHPTPETALKDGRQSLDIQQFELLTKELRIMERFTTKELMGEPLEQALALSS